MVATLRAIPIFGVFFRYMNLYVGKGRPEYVRRVAPFYLWLDRIVVPMSVCMGLALVIVLVGNPESMEFSEDLILNVFPALLGFGIGVFALIFVLPSSLLSRVDRVRAKKGFGSTMIVSDMAFPLCYLVFVILVAVLLKVFESFFWVQWLQFTLFFYGLSLMSDVVGVIAAAALNTTLGRRKELGNGDIQRRETLARLRRR